MPEGICEVLSVSTDAPDDSCTETKVLPDRSSNSIRTGPCIGLVLLKLMCEPNGNGPIVKSSLWAAELMAVEPSLTISHVTECP